MSAIQVAPIGSNGESWVDFALHSPVEMLLVSPDGRRTGFNPARGVVVEEIPGSSYVREAMWDASQESDPTKSLSLDGLAAGTWSLTLYATGDGPFTFEAAGQGAAGGAFREVVTGTVRAGEVRRFTLHHAPGAQVPMALAEGTTIPPIAEAGAGHAVFEGEPVRFDASRSRDLDGTIASFAWDFGDGASATARPRPTPTPEPAFTPRRSS